MQDASSWLAAPNSPCDLQLFLQNSIQDNYERVGAFVRNDSGGSWVEPVSDTEMAFSSFVIYKRKP